MKREAPASVVAQRAMDDRERDLAIAIAGSPECDVHGDNIVQIADIVRGVRRFSRGACAIGRGIVA
jgi:hypothetical protein